MPGYKQYASTLLTSLIQFQPRLYVYMYIKTRILLCVFHIKRYLCEYFIAGGLTSTGKKCDSPCLAEFVSWKHKKYIGIFYHSSTLRWLSTSFLVESDGRFIMHIQYHCCWCPGDARSQGISCHGIHQVFDQYHRLDNIFITTIFN